MPLARVPALRLVSVLDPVRVKVLPLLMVSAPEFVKLPAAVKVALLARVSAPVLLLRFARSFVAPVLIVPPSSVNTDELVVMLAVAVRSRLPARTNVPPESVEPLIWVSAGAVKVSPLLMVSVPVLLKLAAVVDRLLLVPAMVRLLVLEASALRVLTPLELMVPPCSVSVA